MTKAVIKALILVCSPFSFSFRIDFFFFFICMRLPKHVLLDVVGILSEYCSFFFAFFVSFFFFSFFVSSFHILQTKSQRFVGHNMTTDEAKMTFLSRLLADRFNSRLQTSTSVCFLFLPLFSHFSHIFSSVLTFCFLFHFLEAIFTTYAVNLMYDKPLSSSPSLFPQRFFPPPSPSGCSRSIYPVFPHPLILSCPIPPIASLITKKR